MKVASAVETENGLCFRCDWCGKVSLQYSNLDKQETDDYEIETCRYEMFLLILSILYPVEIFSIFVKVIF